MVTRKPDALYKSHLSILRKNESILSDLRSLEEELECYFKIRYNYPVCVCVVYVCGVVCGVCVLCVVCVCGWVVCRVCVLCVVCVCGGGVCGVCVCVCVPKLSSPPLGVEQVTRAVECNP